MIVDTSALLAVLQDEADRRSFNEAIEAADSVALSVASFVETSIVIEARHGADGLRALDRFIERAGIVVAAVDLEQGKLARDAFSRFGKGRHAAALNFGDCFAYALAKVLGEPLLFKGEDFARTDIARVERPPSRSR
jgi:ribonuclease VapC